MEAAEADRTRPQAQTGTRCTGIKDIGNNIAECYQTGGEIRK